MLQIIFTISLKTTINKIQKEFLPYEEALALKELGFDEFCLFHYGKHFHHSKLFLINNHGQLSYNSLKNSDGRIDAPLYQQAFRFFREKYKLHSHFYVHDSGEGFAYEIVKTPVIDGLSKDTLIIEQDGFISQEEAELACIRKLIEIVKQQNLDK